MKNTANMWINRGQPSNSPNKIIVHSMGEIIAHEGQCYFAVDWLRKIKLSAHALITPSGVVITCRNDSEGAYHAKGHNTNSLGVEFLVPGAHNYTTFLDTINLKYLTKKQYLSGIELVQSWIWKHKITRENIFRHSDIDPDRKKDPGRGFPWIQFINDVFDPYKTLRKKEDANGLS